jgi:hypothetical protein
MAYVTLRPGMKKKLFVFAPLLLSSLFLAGCTTAVTNLTPSTQKRNPGALYPFEVALDTRQHCLRRETLRPYVLIGTQIYPMQPTLLMSNRWETIAPISPDKEYVSYRFKFDYKSRAFGAPKPGSKLSPPYQLQILEK